METMYGEPITVGHAVFSIVALGDDSWTRPMVVTAVHEDEGTLEAGGRFYGHKDVLLAEDILHDEALGLLVIQQPEPEAAANPDTALRHNLDAVLEDEAVEMHTMWHHFS